MAGTELIAQRVVAPLRLQPTGFAIMGEQNLKFTIYQL
jgi:hypothetical protein